MSNLVIIKTKIWKKIINFRYNKIYKNILFITKCKFIYLNFVDIYKKDYNL